VIFGERRTWQATPCRNGWATKAARRLFRNLLVAALGLGGACNFDSAFERYCSNNPHCAADAATGRETGPEAAPEVAPEIGVETGPEAGPEAEPDAGPDAALQSPVDFGQGPWSGRDGGQIVRPPRSCQSRNDCFPNEICHPFGQVCMSVCTTSADCVQLPGLDTCAEIRDQGGVAITPKVCTCTASQFCESYGSRCNSTDNLCERPCYTDWDCLMFQPPRACDKMSNVCQGSIQFCLSNADCPSAAQPRCDPVSAWCVGCVDSSDCAGRVDGFSQCSPVGSCVSPSSSP
jgi:hypothetical protein